MTRFDLTPLFRTTVGFDRLFQLFDEISEAPPAYPPYNIEKLDDNRYRITIAVAGFAAEDLEVELKQNALTVRGGRKHEAQSQENASAQNASSYENESPRFLHRGIAERSFTRQFSLAEHVRVEAARLEHGLLHLDLLREVPEADKPRFVEISVGNERLTGVRKETLSAKKVA